MVELMPDGRFRYGLSYGALDERAEGRWRQEGNTIFLTTEPQPRAPIWTMHAATAGDRGLFVLQLESMSGQPVPNIDMELTMSDGSIIAGRTQREPMELELANGLRPLSVRFAIPIYGVESPPVPIAANTNTVRIRLDPADLGVRDFRDWALVIDGDRLARPGAPAREGFWRVPADQ